MPGGITNGRHDGGLLFPAGALAEDLAGGGHRPDLEEPWATH